MKTNRLVDVKHIKQNSCLEFLQCYRILLNEKMHVAVFQENSALSVHGEFEQVVLKYSQSYQNLLL